MPALRDVAAKRRKIGFLTVWTHDVSTNSLPIGIDERNGKNDCSGHIRMADTTGARHCPMLRQLIGDRAVDRIYQRFSGIMLVDVIAVRVASTHGQPRGQAVVKAA